MDLSKEKAMGHENIFKLIVTMSLPAMFSMFIQSLYNIVDSYFVSQYSETALRATSLSFPLQILILAFSVGTGVGVKSLLSRSMGAKDYEQAKQSIYHGYILVFVTWIAFILLNKFMLDRFFHIFTQNNEVIVLGEEYLNIILWGSIFVLMHILAEKALQGSGNMMIPMISQTVGALTNIVLDPIFIFKLEMGIKGAAIATLIGQSISMLIVTYGLWSRHFSLKLEFGELKWNSRMILNIYDVGFPSILMQSIGAFLTIALNKLIVNFSELSVSALGIYFKLESFVLMPVFGLGQGVLPIIGYNFGANNRDRVRQAFSLSKKIALFMMIVGFAIFQLFPRQLVGIFSQETELVEMGSKILRIISLYYIPSSFAIMNSIMFQAIGIGRYSLIVSFLRQLGILLPMAYFMSNFGLYYIFLAYPISELISLILSQFLVNKTKINL